MLASVLQHTAEKVIEFSVKTVKNTLQCRPVTHKLWDTLLFVEHVPVCVQCVRVSVNLRYVSALTTPARLSPVEFHYPPLPPQVPTFQITSPNTSHALSLPPAAAAYHRDEDQPLLRCPEVRKKQNKQTNKEKKTPWRRA